jgi:hypothetical protein
LDSHLRLRLAILSVLALASVGCGGGTGRVTGHVVRKDGKPLEGANLVARNAETGKSVYATTDAAGSFELSQQKPSEGVPPGSYEVTIVERRPDRDAMVKPTISAKYSDPAKSGVKFSVAAGETKVVDVTVDPP